MTFKKSLIIAAIVVAFMSAAAYINTLGNSFLYDDEVVVVRNDFIKSWANIGELFSRNYFNASGELSYRPVVTLTYLLDYYFWSLNPSGYHLTNLLLHAVNSALLLYLGYILFGDIFLALIAAAIFAVHPAISEAVNSVGFREDLLAFLFSLAALIAHSTYGQLSGGGQRPLSSTVALLACGFSYALALLSKESALITPALAVSIDFLRSGRVGLSSIMRKKASYAVFLSLTLVYGFVRFSLMYNPIEARLDYPGSSLYTNFLTMSKVVGHYLNILFFPVRLNADYDFPISASILDWRVVVSLGLIAAAVMGALKWGKRISGLALGLCWFFIALIPVYNIMPLANIIAERYLYMPAAGFGIAMAGVFRRSLGPGGRALPQKGKHMSGPAVTALILALLMINTVSRNRVWHDENSLWRDTVLKSPAKSRVRFGLGVALKKAGSIDKALREQLLAVSINPRFAMARLHLGNLYNDLGLMDKTAIEYSAAAMLGPTLADGHNNLGNLLKDAGYLDKAMAELKAALKANPRSAEAHNNFGVVFFKRGDFKSAERYFQKALNIRPSYADAFFNLGSILLLGNKQDKAALKYLETLRRDPGYADAHFGLGDILKSKGFYRLAEGQYLAAGLNSPRKAQASFRLADLYAWADQRSKAVSELKNAAYLSSKGPKAAAAFIGKPPMSGVVIAAPPAAGAGNYALKLALIYKQQGLAHRAIFELMKRSEAGLGPAALNEMAILLYSKGRLERAKRVLLEASKLGSTSPEPLFNLGAIFQVQGARDKAYLHYALSFKRKPDYADALVGIGDIYLKGDRAAEALESYSKATALDMGNQRAHMNAGAARLSLGMVDGAMNDYKVALYLGPHSAEANKNLGAIYLQKLKDPMGAKVFFRRALELYPEGKDAAAMREILSGLKE